jgi:hypothetical protein
VPEQQNKFSVWLLDLVLFSQSAHRRLKILFLIRSLVMAHGLRLVLSFLFSTRGVKGLPLEFRFPLKCTKKSFISRFGSSLGAAVFLTDPSFHRLASFLVPANLLFSCCASHQARSFLVQRVCGSRFILPRV